MRYGWLAKGEAYGADFVKWCWLVPGGASDTGFCTSFSRAILDDVVWHCEVAGGSWMVLGSATGCGVVRRDAVMCAVALLGAGWCGMAPCGPQWCKVVLCMRDGTNLFNVRCQLTQRQRGDLTASNAIHCVL